MRFSWTGMLLAPLLAPALFSLAFAAMSDTEHPFFAFLVLLVPGFIVSFGTTVVLFLPSLFLLSRFWRISGLRVCLLGLVLGAALFVPMTWIDWKSSGPDSGPPTESFPVFFARWAADPFTAIYPLAGLVTAELYWWLGTWRLRRSGSPQ